MWGQIFSTEWTNLIAMVPLLIGSIITLGIIIERLMHFRPERMFNQATVDKVVEHIGHADPEAAMQVVDKRETLLERLLAEGLQDHYKKQVIPEVAFLDHGMSRLDVLATWVPVLNFIARLAPLLGLLGTVLGMIASFEVIAASSGENATVKPEEVAIGIGTALLTTATGLMVAIPAMATATVLTRIGKRVYQQFEDAFRQVTIAAGGLRGDYQPVQPTAVPVVKPDADKPEKEELADRPESDAGGELPAGEPA